MCNRNVFNYFNRYFYVIVGSNYYVKKLLYSLPCGSVCSGRLYNFCCAGSRDGVGNKLLLPSANLVPNGDRCGSMPMIVALVGTLRKCSNFSWKEKLQPAIERSFRGYFLRYTLNETENGGEPKNMFPLKITAFLGGSLCVFHLARYVILQHNTDDGKNGWTLFSVFVVD